MKQICKITLIQYMDVLSQFGESETREDENKELRKLPWSRCSLNRISKYEKGWLNYSS